MNKCAKTEFKQKDLIIRKIGMEYKKIKFMDDNSSLINEDSHPYFIDKNGKYDLVIKKKIDYILLQMEKTLSMIIYNEYFSSKIDNWWMYYFSKSTYYRLKNKAMDNFLEWWYA